MIANDREQIRRRLQLALGLFVGLFMFATAGYWVLGWAQGVDFPLMDCAYMTVISLTTVGYGEVIDLTKVTGGRLFTMGILAMGLGIAVYFSASLTTFLVEGEFEHIRARRKMKKLLDGLKGHVIVCGVGAAGARAVDELVSTRTPLVMIDNDQERIARIAQHYPDVDLPYVVGDALSDDVLREAGIERAKGIICALSDDRDNIYMTISSRQLGPNLRIVAKGEDIESVEKLKRAGADSVVTPAYIGGLRMVSEMIRPQTVQFLDVMMRDKEKNMRIEDVTIPEGSPAIGKQIRDELFRGTGNFLVLAFRDPKDGILQYAPSGNNVLGVGTHLIVLGGPETIGRLRATIEGRS